MIEHTRLVQVGAGDDRRQRPFDATALAKVLDRDPDGHLYHFRYPLKDGAGLRQATTSSSPPRGPRRCWATRPWPCIPRTSATRHLVGKMVVLPLVGREIPIVADEYSDPEKGSGAVKITPAHDFNDYEVGKRHELEAHQHLRCARRSSTTSVPENYRGLDRFEARKQVVADLEALGLVEKIEPHTHAVPHAQRGNAVIEPWLTDQWYVEAPSWRSRRSRRSRAARRTFVPEELGEDLLRVDAQHPALVHLAPALVGAQIPAWYGPDGEDASSRLRQRGMRRAHRAFVAKPRSHRRARETLRVRTSDAMSTTTIRSTGRVASSATPTCSTPGSRRRCGRSRRWAGRSKTHGAEALLSDQRARHRLRHHLLLGRAHDDDGPALHEGGAVPRRLHPRPGARREGAEDVEDQGQRHRPAGADRRVRRRRAALHAGRHGGAGPRHQALDQRASRAIATSRPSSGTRRASPR